LSSCINLYKEVETHAQYEIVDTKIAVGQTPLWAVAKEMARLVDELDDESTADDAGRLLGTMLACTPSLLLAVLPSLIPRLVRSGRMGAIIRALLRDCRTPALRALVASLSCEDPVLKTQIVQTIGQFGEEAKEVLPVLIAGLSCEDPMPRGQIAQAIGQLGREAKEALPALEPLLHDESSVRLMAAMAIWRIDARIAGIVPIIVEGLRCAELSREAGNCLREMGPDAAEVVPALVQLLISGKQSWERANAAVALGGMGLEAVVGIPALMSAIEDANNEVHWSAFGALRELRALARTGELVLQGFEVR
jgi:HEAT repeat protein